MSSIFSAGLYPVLVYSSGQQCRRQGSSLWVLLILDKIDFDRLIVGVLAGFCFLPRERQRQSQLQNDGSPLDILLPNFQMKTDDGK